MPDVQNEIDQQNRDSVSIEINESNRDNKLLANGQNGVDQQNRVSVSSEIREISDDNKFLAAYVEEKLDSVSPSAFGRFCTIYKVQDKFRKITEDAYIPEMVSIGPFHHGKAAYQAMEIHKLRYVYELLSRIGNRREKLEECMEAISKLEAKARACYSEPVEPDKKKFIEMMVVDSLFIIELLRKSAGEEGKHDGDPIFTTMWGIDSLVRDMILLENQLPMFVLVRLFNLTVANPSCKPLKELAIRFFNPLMQREEYVLERYFKTKHYSNLKGRHLLDILNKAFHDWPHREATNPDLTLRHVPCVTELRQGGVKFRRGSNEGSVIDIRFNEGVLTIPPILIHDGDSLLRNLIVSEQCCDGQATHMASYALLMADLIKSSNDVEFLREKGIIKNSLGDNECVSLFDKLCREVIVPNYYYSDLCKQLDVFCHTRWHVLLAALRRDYIATLRREYYRSPWKVVSLLAGGILMILTLTSTVFAVLSFVVHKQ